MNKEVEDALHMLLHCSLKDTEYETQVEQYKIVRDYIIDLQQENKQLKEDKKKAREFIEEWCTINPTTGKCVCYLDKNRCTELYKILGDKENE